MKKMLGICICLLIIAVVFPNAGIKGFNKIGFDEKNDVINSVKIIADSIDFKQNMFLPITSSITAGTWIMGYGQSDIFANFKDIIKTHDKDGNHDGYVCIGDFLFDCPDNKIIVAMLDLNGNFLPNWPKTIYIEDTDSYGTSIVENYYSDYNEMRYTFTGFSDPDNNGNFDVIVIQIDKDGNVEFANRYGYDDNDDYAYSIVTDGDEKSAVFAIVGGTIPSGDYIDSILLILDKDGVMTDGVLYEIEDEKDIAKDVVFEMCSNLTSLTIAGDLTEGGIYVINVVFSDPKSITWAYRYFTRENNVDSVQSLKKKIDGGYILVGKSESDSFVDMLALTIRNDGGLIDFKLYDAGDIDEAFCVDVLDDGNFLMIGTSDTIYEKDIIIIKLNRTLNVTWSKFVEKFDPCHSPLERNDYGFAIEITDDGFVFAGLTQRSDNEVDMLAGHVLIHWFGSCCARSCNLRNHSYDGSDDIEIQGIKDMNYFSFEITLKTKFVEDFIICLLDPPKPPEIDGPKIVKPGIENTWRFLSFDPNDDIIRYYIEWGDGTNTETNCTDSGTLIEEKHTFSYKGNYEIKAKAIECDGFFESDWSMFEVSIPRTNPKIYYPLQDLFSQFSNLLPLLLILLQQSE